MAAQDLKQMYRTQNVGNFPDAVEVMGRAYRKVEDLRYGTNPHQPAAFYRPLDGHCVLGAYQVLKTGKSGLSQTNLEDMHHAVGILKYLTKPACAVMKHCNPSGVAMQAGEMSLRTVYERARDADAQAAFGSVVVFNTEVDADTAAAIMETIVEGVAAPNFTAEALGILHDGEGFKRNREMRIIKLPDLARLPKFLDDGTNVREIKVFDDGSLVIAMPYLSRVKTTADLVPATSEHPKKGVINISRQATARELEDLLFAWYVNIHVRSNGVVIVKNGQTLAVGTGEQDRVGAVEQAVHKAKTKYKGVETLSGAVMASDGFFPFRDAVDAATRAGVTAIVQPGGSVNDYEAIVACNDVNAAMMFSQERCFSHH
ncbi:MAG: IMP cyclohydrolase [Candidatus Hydrogenedentales bacterium]